MSWISAASGVWHVEYPDTRIQEKGGYLEMIQIWLRSPGSVRELAPTYQDIKENLFPVLVTFDYKIKVLAGTHQTRDSSTNEEKLLISPIKSESDVLFLDIELNEKSNLLLPVDKNYDIYIYLYKGNFGFFGPDQTKLSYSDCLKFKKTDSERSFISATGSNSGKISFLLIGVTKIDESFVKKNSFVAGSSDQLKTLFWQYENKKIAKMKPIYLKSFQDSDVEENSS